MAVGLITLQARREAIATQEKSRLKNNDAKMAT
jgi:hypothetical protein